MNPEARFEKLVDELASTSGVTVPGGGTGFGAGALRLNNKIFAMLVRGRLVVKLPRARVDALVASGDGVRFDANKGKPMAEWLVVDQGSRLAWSAVAREAMAFVGGAASKRG